APRRRPLRRLRRAPGRPHHLAALPGPDRLSRAAPLCVRAARARRAPRRRDRCALAGDGTRGDRPYVADMTAVFANARRFLAPGAPVVLVVDDSRELFGTILDGAGLQIREQRLRHVNRRTGRRAGEFYEQVILAAA